MSTLMQSALGAITLLAMAAYPGLAAPSGGDPLAPYLWKARVLVVVAPAADDPKLLRQQETFRAMKAGATERDLALVEAVGNSDQARALRTRFGLSHDGFHAVLVGKDGGDKLTSEEPLGPDALFPLIDSMPMRQGEMRQKS